LGPTKKADETGPPHRSNDVHGTLACGMANAGDTEVGPHTRTLPSADAVSS
jgi:hypothetical protein